MDGPVSVVGDEPKPWREHGGRPMTPEMRQSLVAVLSMNIMALESFVSVRFADRLAEKLVTDGWRLNPTRFRQAARTSQPMRPKDRRIRRKRSPLQAQDEKE